MSAHHAAPAAATHAAPKAKGASLKTKVIAGLIVFIVLGSAAALVPWGSLQFHNPFASTSAPAPVPGPIAVPPTPPAPARPRVDPVVRRASYCTMCAGSSAEGRIALRCIEKGCP